MLEGENSLFSPEYGYDYFGVRGWSLADEVLFHTGMGVVRVLCWMRRLQRQCGVGSCSDPIGFIKDVVQ